MIKTNNVFKLTIYITIDNNHPNMFFCIYIFFFCVHVSLLVNKEIILSSKIMLETNIIQLPKHDILKSFLEFV